MKPSHMKILQLKKGRMVYPNVIYRSKPLRWWNFQDRRDLKSMFGGEDVMMTNNPKLLDLLVNFKAFNNNAEARNAGYTNKMPDGYSEIIISRHPTEKKAGYYLYLCL